MTVGAQLRTVRELAEPKEGRSARRETFGFPLWRSPPSRAQRGKPLVSLLGVTGRRAAERVALRRPVEEQWDSPSPELFIERLEPARKHRSAIGARAFRRHAI